MYNCNLIANKKIFSLTFVYLSESFVQRTLSKIFPYLVDQISFMDLNFNVFTLGYTYVNETLSLPVIKHSYTKCNVTLREDMNFRQFVPQ